MVKLARHFVNRSTPITLTQDGFNSHFAACPRLFKRARWWSWNVAASTTNGHGAQRAIAGCMGVMRWGVQGEACGAGTWACWMSQAALALFRARQRHRCLRRRQQQRFVRDLLASCNRGN